MAQSFELRLPFAEGQSTEPDAPLQFWIPVGPLVREQVLLDRIGGNREALPRMVAVALESVIALPGKLREALNTGDREAMAFNAHYAKGTAGYLELPWLHALALTAERAAHKGVPECAESIEALAQALDSLIEDLRRLADTLAS